MTILQGVAFDLDGVLVDSELQKAASHVAAAASFGSNVSVKDYADVLGGSATAVARHVLAVGGLSVPVSEYQKAFARAYQERLGLIRSAPGALALLTELKQMGVRVGIATSSDRETVEALVSSCGFDRLVDAVVSSDDVVNHKPHPACYVELSKLLGVARARQVAVEDTNSGVSAARGAGLAVVGLRHALNHSMQFDASVPVLQSLANTRQVVDALTRTLPT